MNNYILIKVTGSISRFISKCNKYNFSLLDINYISNDEILVKVKKECLKEIKRYNYYSNVEVYKKIGKDRVLENMCKFKYFIITFIFCIVMMYFFSNIIISINVIHSNKSIRELVYVELEEYGIKKFDFKKDFNELEKIKDKVLENNKDKLEWISITNVGMKYVIRVEERIIDEIKTSDDYCDIVSLKDSFITDIYALSGEILVSENDYVRKGDILISGDIFLNEELKGRVCSEGVIKGKVWYNTSIVLDREYLKKEYTNNSRYNMSINNKVLRKVKYNKFDKDYIVKNNFFSLYKELEYKNKSYVYTDKELEEKALLELKNKFKDKLGDNGKIVEVKVLNKKITDKYIEMNFFVETEESIGRKIIKDITLIN